MYAVAKWAYSLLRKIEFKMILNIADYHRPTDNGQPEKC